MQASSLAASLSRCCAGLRGVHSPPRAFPARPRPPSVRRLRVVAASSAADRPPRDDAAPSPSASTAAPKPKGGKRDLADAYREVREILTDPTRLVRAVAGGKARGADPQWRRLEMRPVALKKGGIKLQVVKYDERQAFTSNHPYPAAATPTPNSNPGASRGRSRGRRGGASSASSSPSSVPDASSAVDDAFAVGFANWRVETPDEVLQLRVTKSGEALVNRTRQLLSNAKGAKGAEGGGASVVVPASHDRVKPRLLDPSDPFLVRVGVSVADGSAIKASRRDKYKQVEEFVKLVQLAVSDARTGSHMAPATRARPARLVDLGCGNAYLTFGAYAYLAARKELGGDSPMEVIGVDVKRQARETNTRVARELGWDASCVFVEGTIADATLRFPTPRPDPSEPEVDIVLALHACDTATDEALTRAVRWNAPLTLVSPCCHHDLQVRMRAAAQAYPPLTRHGILRERLGDVVTDAFRAHILRLLGHRVDVTEWIGGEHTPRNTMIRAVKTGSPAGLDLWREYDAMVEDWGVTPRLAEQLAPELAAARAQAEANEAAAA